MFGHKSVQVCVDSLNMAGGVHFPPWRGRGEQGPAQNGLPVLCLDGSAANSGAMFPSCAVNAGPERGRYRVVVHPRVQILEIGGVIRPHC